MGKTKSQQHSINNLQNLRAVGAYSVVAAFDRLNTCLDGYQYEEN
jgi:hypothetical protein